LRHYDGFCGSVAEDVGVPAVVILLPNGRFLRKRNLRQKHNAQRECSDLHV
jgi:hypothetical protein